MTYASLCFLSFNRPHFIGEAINSAVHNADYPCEVIVHDDGSDVLTQDLLLGMLRGGQISKLILNPIGHNEGVGAAINRSFACATGDIVCKLDQDLVFHQGWMRSCAEWLERDPDLAMLGLFKYYTDPVDWHKMNHRRPPHSPHVEEAEWNPGYEYCDDFVGSAMVIPREVLDEYGPFDEHSEAFAEDVMYKKMLQSKGLELGLPVADLARNRGFGVGPSTVVINHNTVQTIHKSPVVFNA